MRSLLFWTVLLATLPCIAGARGHLDIGAASANANLANQPTLSLTACAGSGVIRGSAGKGPGNRISIPAKQ